MRARALLAALLAASVACGGEPAGDPSRSPTPEPTRPAVTASATANPDGPVNPTLPRVEVAFGDRVVRAEVADDARERAIGLMNRTRMGADDGMLFLLETTSQSGFWMKNTLLPLSIAYLRRGGERFEVVDIRDMEPCRRDPCPSYPPSAPYDAALEMNQGWFEEAGIEVGDEGVVRGAI